MAVVQYTFTHKQYIEQHNENGIYRTEQNRTYVTIRIRRMAFYEVVVDYTCMACDGTVFGMMDWKRHRRRDHRLFQRFTQKFSGLF